MAGAGFGALTGRLRGKQPAGVPRPQSLRLTFTFDDDGVRLARSTERPKPAPRGTDLVRERPPDRIVLELRRSDGAVVYRTALRDPLPQAREVFEPGGTIRRGGHAPRSGTFSAVVPIHSQGDHVVLVAGERVTLAQPGLAAALRGSGAARELGRLPLRPG